MKCRLESPNTVCERCARKSLDCVFEKHRRGRKSTRYLPPSLLLRRPKTNCGRPKLQPQDSESPATAGEYFGSPARQQDPTQHVVDERVQDDRAWISRTESQFPSVSERWSISDSLQPSNLLSKEAQSGHFSLQNVLSIPNLLTTDSTPSYRNEKAPSKESLDTDDPIFCNLLSYPIALGLFDKWVLFSCTMLAIKTDLKSQLYALPQPIYQPIRP